MSRTDDRLRGWEHERKRPYCHEMPRLEPSLWDTFKAYLLGRKVSWKIAKANGWYPSVEAGDASPRVVIPCTSSDKTNLFWQARAMDDNPKRYMSPSAARGDAVCLVWPLAATETRLNQQGKGEIAGHGILEGHRGAQASSPQEEPEYHRGPGSVYSSGVDTSQSCAVVEGPFDALSAAGEGLLGLALLNSTPSEEVLAWSIKLAVRRHCLLIADTDSPLTMANLVAYFANRGAASARMLLPTPYKDLTEMPHELRGRFLRG